MSGFEASAEAVARDGSEMSSGVDSGWSRRLSEEMISSVGQSAREHAIKGLTDKPVIAVSTSVGYGASFEGIAALLGMLSSCSSGIGVVNIDNGFGAGALAAVIVKNKHSA